MLRHASLLMDSNMTYTEPVRPEHMALLFAYPCPFCGTESVLISPTAPATVTCKGCRNEFNIVSVDAQTVQYVETMLDEGRAAADPSF